MRVQLSIALTILGLLIVPAGHADPAGPAQRLDPAFNPAGKANDGATAEQATKIANLAMHAVYDRCSKFAAFREGSTLEGDYQNYKRVFSNVGVHLADPAKAQDNVLWYVVFFRGDKPVTLKATKEIAAQLCGLPGKDVEVKL